MGNAASSLSNVFLAAQGVNAAAGAVNTYQQVQAQRAQGSAQKQAAYDNAAMMELQARDAERQGERAAALRGLDTRAILDAQASAAAGQGVSVNSGSVQKVMSDASAFGNLDAEMEATNAWRRAFGMRSSAEYERRAGRDAKSAANYKARMSAAAGGLQFGRDLVEGTDKYGKFRDNQRIRSQRSSFQP